MEYSKEDLMEAKKQDSGVDTIVSRDRAVFAGSSIPRKTARECLEAML